MKRLLAAVFGLSLVGATPAAPPAAAKRSPALGQARNATAQGTKIAAWVFFIDKGPGAEARVRSTALMTPRAASRRRLRGQVSGPTVEDLPVAAAYVDQVAARVARVRQYSRWLNAVSVEATPAQLEAVESPGSVARPDLVRRYPRRG